MPFYQYRHPATGETREEYRAIYDRDVPPAEGFQRVPAVPAPPNLHAKSEARMSIQAQVARGLKKGEGDPAFRDLHPAAVKAAWGLN